MIIVIFAGIYFTAAVAGIYIDNELRKINRRTPITIHPTPYISRTQRMRVKCDMKLK